MPFGTVITKLKLVHVVERKVHHACETFEIDSTNSEFDEKFDIWFGEVTIAQTFSSYIQFDCKGYVLSDTFSFSNLSSGCSSSWKNESS